MREREREREISIGNERREEGEGGKADRDLLEDSDRHITSVLR
jgi:hypothetical protein